MAINDKNILYFTRTMGQGGTEKVILQLCRYFNTKFNKIIVCSCGGVHEGELENLGIKHYTIGDIESKSPIFMIRTFFEIYRIIKKENINIVHTHHRMAAFYISILQKVINFRFVHTAHNTFNNKIKFTNFVLKNAHIIAVGNMVKENLVNTYSLNEDKIEVIYNGIANDNEPLKEISEIKQYKDNGYFIVGNIGRLSVQKGMKYYIQSIPDVLCKNKKIMFYIIGAGEEMEELKKLTKELQIENNVHFLGYRNDIYNVIKQLDLVVLSSLWEGLPLTPIEAFSEGKTVVATNVDGTPEIIKNKINGILVESKNSQEISDAVLLLSNNKKLRSKLEKEAIKTYYNNFTIEKFNKTYHECYREISI